MADGTAALRTARSALQDGLISEQDYADVKTAFLKAQQFKAGLDAGFITEADYAEVKSRFLDAFCGLNVSGDGFSSGAATPQRPGSPSLFPSGGGPAQQQQQLPQQGGGAASASAAAPAAAAMPGMHSNGPAPPAVQQPAAVSQPARESGSGTGEAATGVDVPRNIPSMGGALRKKNSGPQTSMSGIAVSDDAINLFYYMKAKSAYQWAMWGINGKGDEIVIVDVGAKDSSYESFLAKLPPNDCRFAVYDYQVTNSEGRVFDKLVFISWSPDTARIKSKMMYASTKDFFKSFLEGLSVELQVSDTDEITEKDIHEHVLSVLTRK